MSSTMNTPLSYMSISASLIDNGKSFEEVRIDDYIRAYRTTGQPPKCMPQVPSGDMERSSMGLPLLFKPISEHDSVLAGRPKNSPLPPRIAGFNNRVGSGAGAASTGGGDVARKISDPGELPEFQDFKSAKVAGETFLTISCSEQFSAFSPEELRCYSHKYKSRPEVLQCITSNPEFSQHSFEELRVVYMLSGKELTSAQIIAALRGHS